MFFLGRCRPESTQISHCGVRFEGRGLVWNEATGGSVWDRSIVQTPPAFSWSFEEHTDSELDSSCQVGALSFIMVIEKSTILFPEFQKLVSGLKRLHRTFFC